VEESGEPSNIVADFDGVIISDETYQGAKNISRGNAIRKGDVLISGVVEGIDSKPLYYEAKGKFTALRETQSQIVAKAEEKLRKPCKERNFFSLIIFGFRLPLSFSVYPTENEREYVYREYLTYNGYVLPFAVEKKTVISFEETAVSSERLIKMTCMKYSEYVYDKYKNSNIVSCDVKIKSEKDKVIISGEYKTIDFIGASKPIIIENIEN
jgi:similar to stage IV sporulation protein